MTQKRMKLKMLRKKYEELKIYFEFFEDWDTAKQEMDHEVLPDYIYIQEEDKLYKMKG